MPWLTVGLVGSIGLAVTGTSVGSVTEPNHALWWFSIPNGQSVLVTTLFYLSVALLIVVCFTMIATISPAPNNTFSYTETAAAYLAPMNGLITSQLSQTLKNGYTTLGVAQIRTSQKQISTGTAAIDSIRTFGSGSITFVVTGTQKLTSTKGTSTNNNQYAVTVTGQGSSWQVYDIEPASAGNF